MLKLEHIRKGYDGKGILKDITLNIQDGEIVSILGPSGSGKTTILNLILGITHVDDGKIFMMIQILRKCQWKKEALISFFRIMPFFRI